MKNTKHIEQVYAEHSKRLYNISLRIVADCYDAEEVMHDTLLQYCRSGSKEDIIDLRKWLSSVCIRKSIDRLRHRHRYKAMLEEYEDPVTEDDENTELRYEVKDILKALSEIPDHYRAIVSLHLFEGYDYQEISVITQIKESTVRSMYLRGRMKLIEKLTKTRT